jgi:hypothetical protein
MLGVWNALVALLVGVAKVFWQRMWPEKPLFRIVVYNKDNSPRIAQTLRCSEDRALRATTKEWSWHGCDRAILERFENGRWVPIAEAPSRNEDLPT